MSSPSRRRARPSGGKSGRYEGSSTLASSPTLAQTIEDWSAPRAPRVPELYALAGSAGSARAEVAFVRKVQRHYPRNRKASFAKVPPIAHGRAGRKKAAPPAAWGVAEDPVVVRFLKSGARPGPPAPTASELEGPARTEQGTVPPPTPPVVLGEPAIFEHGGGAGVYMFAVLYEDPNRLWASSTSNSGARGGVAGVAGRGARGGGRTISGGGVDSYGGAFHGGTTSDRGGGSSADSAWPPTGVVSLDGGSSESEGVGGSEDSEHRAHRLRGRPHPRAVYFGSAWDIFAAREKNKQDLLAGTHCCVALQQAYDEACAEMVCDGGDGGGGEVEGGGLGVGLGAAGSGGGGGRGSDPGRGGSAGPPVSFEVLETIPEVNKMTGVRLSFSKFEVYLEVRDSQHERRDEKRWEEMRREAKRCEEMSRMMRIRVYPSCNDLPTPCTLSVCCTCSVCCHVLWSKL